MQDSQFESSLDSPSDWIGLDIELEEKIISEFVSDYNQKAKTISQVISDDSQKEAWRESLFREHHSSPKSQSQQIESRKSSHTQQIQSNQCCAFRKLDEVLGSKAGNESGRTHQGSCKRLVLWVEICRNRDSSIDDFIKRSCPLSRCTFSCNPDNGELMQHILKCSFRKYGTYRCPYCNNSEEFTIPYQRRPRKPWSRTKSLREAFHSICELGSKGIHKALCHSNKRQRDDTLDDHSTDNESTTSETKGDSKAVYNRPTDEHAAWSEKPPLPVQRSQALQSRIQSQIREIDDTTLISELESNSYREFTSTIKVPQPIELPAPIIEVIAAFENSDTDTYIPTPISSSSSERLGSPISPLKSSSGKKASFGGMSLEWPVSQTQTLQPTPTLSVSRAANERRRARGMQNLFVDTSRATSRSVTPSKSDSPTEQHLSTPDNPEVLTYESIRVFHHLRNTFYNTYMMSHTKLSISSQLQINRDDAFLSGWTVVEDVLRGKLPQDFCSLFSLAQLAFACGQVVWEGKLKYQIDDIVNELKVWSHALCNLHERQYYQEVIEQIFVKKGSEMYHKTTSSSSPSSASSMTFRTALSLDGRQLLGVLREGVVIRLCLQFLSTYEFLQYRAERKKSSTIIHTNILQETRPHDDNVNILDSVIIRPLLATDQFLAFKPMIEKGIDLLLKHPNTTSRELEVFLVCHTRYYTQDHTLHLQFRQAIADVCSKTKLHEPIQYLLEDITAVRQCQKDLAHSQEINRSGLQPSYANIDAISELHGSPVEFSFPHFTYTTQDRSSCVYPRSGPGRRHYYSPIQTPISANTSSPSTATSTQAPSIFTPISGHSISPATATESIFTYESMDWQETDFANFAQLPDYTLLPNNVISADMMISSEIIANDLTLFNTGIPTNTELPTGPEAKASRSCHKCGKVFTSKEQHLSSNRQRHMREQHGSNPGVTCEICQKVFKRKHNLKVHMNTVHSHERTSLHSQDRNSVHSQDRNSMQSQDRSSVYSQGWS